ncbi:MAG: hypothetical protein U0235_26025 [Polyangiaceae bacterium]
MACALVLDPAYAEARGSVPPVRCSAPPAPFVHPPIEGGAR